MSREIDIQGTMKRIVDSGVESVMSEHDDKDWVKYVKACADAVAFGNAGARAKSTASAMKAMIYGVRYDRKVMDTNGTT